MIPNNGFQFNPLASENKVWQKLFGQLIEHDQPRTTAIKFLGVPKYSGPQVHKKNLLRP